MFKALGEMVRGERPLGETYWLWFIVPHIPVIVLIWAVALSTLNLIAINPKLYYGLLYGAYSASLGITLISGFGVFQSAFKQAKSRFWAAIAMTIVAANIVYGGVRTPALLFGTYHVTDSDRRQATLLLNAQLPKKLDAITTLVHIEILGSTITYYFVIDAKYANRLSTVALRPIMRPKICALFLNTFRAQHVTKVIYKYSSEGAELFKLEFTEADC